MRKPAQAQACGPLPEIPSIPRRAKSSFHVPAPKLAYCPITYILALAHAERAFKNERLTPDYILRLREPPMETSFPVSVLPRSVRLVSATTPSGAQTAPSPPSLRVGPYTQGSRC